MNKDQVTYGLIGLLLGIVLTWLFASFAVNGQHGNMMKMMGMRMQHENSSMMKDTDNSPTLHNNGGSMDSTMSSMIGGLQGKTGDEFDKAFIAEMIVHHQGAVKMAEAALVNAKHQEIKDLANAIITAQNKEIQEMQAWQKEWYLNK